MYQDISDMLELLNHRIKILRERFMEGRIPVEKFDQLENNLRNMVSETTKLLEESDYPEPEYDPNNPFRINTATLKRGLKK